MRTLLFALLAMLPHRAASADAQISITSVSLDVSTGHVVGAAFVRNSDTLAIQRTIIDERRDNEKFREISVWSLTNVTKIASRNLGRLPDWGCGRVEEFRPANEIVVCSAGNSLEVLDSLTLATVATIGTKSGEFIFDFCIDENRREAIVLSESRDRVIRVTVYNLSNQMESRSAILPSDSLSTMNIALDATSGQIAVNIVRDRRMGDRSDIYLCGNEKALTCEALKRLKPVAQMKFLGRKLLLTSDESADDKKECILSVSPRSKEPSPEFCSPKTGVHFGLAIADSRYVIAFTGLSHYSIIAQETTSKRTSFSVWEAEHRLPTAVVEDPADYGGFQNLVKIIGSPTAPMFLTFRWDAKILVVYSIKSSDADVPKRD